MRCKVCEIHISGKPVDVSSRIKEFIDACEFLLKKGINFFYIYSQDNNRSSVCAEILKAYKRIYPYIKVIKRKQRNTKKIENVVIFNWLNKIVVYDENFVTVNFDSQTNKNKTFEESEIDFSEVDLID